MYKTAHHEYEELKMAERAHELGLDAKIMDPAALKSLEPDIRLSVRGGIFFPGDAHLYPNLFIKQLIDYLKKNGVNFITGKSVVDISSAKGKVDKIQLNTREEIKVSNVLLSGGSWTAKLYKMLGLKLLLQDGKGYSITKKNAELRPFLPTILSEAKVAVTPMGNDLRIGGTLEISNFSDKINHRRLEGIIESIPKYYPDLQIEMPDQDKVWYGYRPCTPDGMPYIDQSQKFNNLYVATGHGMMGMSLGPATGKMVSEIFMDKKTSIPNELMQLR